MHILQHRKPENSGMWYDVTRRNKDMTKGEFNMAYETKVLLIALAQIIRKADSIEEIYKAVEKMANAEGVVLEPLNEEKKANKQE